MNKSDAVREYARSNYIEPARQRQDPTVRVMAGEVQRALHLENRSPLVCAALRSKKFLAQNGIALEKQEGPPSGMSTTVAFTYRLTGDAPAPQPPDQYPLLRLWGIGKDVFRDLGGAEAFIRKQREPFYGPLKKALFDPGEDA